jgi:hypothetical protein
LYKDGIGAAYRIAKAAASTAVFQGISADVFNKHFWPACDSINKDNAIGRLSFKLTKQVQKRRIARKALIFVTQNEQELDGHKRYMSTVLWDMFTGSAPYKEIFMRALSPGFLFSFIVQIFAALLHSEKVEEISSPQLDN